MASGMGRPYLLFGFHLYHGSVRPLADSSMSRSRRLSLVSSFLALRTHHVAARWYDGGWDRKNAQAAVLAFNSFPYGPSSVRGLFSYE
jgi:hypothetical protein